VNRIILFASRAAGVEISNFPFAMAGLKPVTTFAVFTLLLRGFS
jgi:hypothetical protein